MAGSGGRYMKKVISISMLFILLFLVMTGCSSKEKNENLGEQTSNSKLARGRYVEEDVEIPSDVHYIISFTVSPGGDIELHGYGKNSNYLKYLYVDKEWAEDELDVLKKAVSTSAIQIDRLFYGEDKNLYVLADEFLSYRNALYRLSDSGELEKIDVKRFEESYEEWNNLPYRPEIIEVLENGMIAVTYLWRELEVYSPDGQSAVGDFSCGYPSVMTTWGNDIYFTDKDNSKLLKMNADKNEEQAAIPFEIEISDKGIIKYDGNTVYICDVTGIHLIKDGGSIWETIVDGSQSSLGMPSLELNDFLLGTEDDYYFILQDADGRYIKHIYFDENASIIPESELSIFSIEDSKTIRQAISIFQQSYPDIKINFRVANLNKNRTYTYGIKNPEATVTIQDQINALNTELLSNKGADIIILDGLPIDSYLDKGVLEDMGDIFSPMIENDKLLANIADNYIDDGKVYTMPVRFRLPIIYGVSEAVEAAKSLEELATYSDENKDIRLLNPSNYRAMAAWFLLLYYNQILNDANEIDQALLVKFLENINKIAINIESSDDVPIDGIGTADGITMGYWIIGDISLHKKLTKINISEVKGINDFPIPLEAASKWNGTFDVINNTYRASTLIGLNSASNNKELAKEFIQFLYSEEIQGADLMDGFPISKIAMEDLINRNVNSSSSFGSGDYQINAFYPTQGNRELIYEEIKSLERPMENDSTMIDMILDEAERYLRSDISIQQAVDNIMSSINTYLSE